MDFRLSDETVEFQRRCHRFAAEVMRPAAIEHDRAQEVPWEVIREALVVSRMQVAERQRLVAEAAQAAVHAAATTGTT